MTPKTLSFTAAPCGDAASAPPPDPARATTVSCYEFWDRVFRQAGLPDYTEGFYDGNPKLPFDQAKGQQLNYLLDQVECRVGSRILDVGCGNGRLLEEVRRRGATGVGVTISPEQVRYCSARGLDVRLLDYRNLSPEWNDRFDAVVANGSIEHFVQVEDAIEGRTDQIYRDFFAICHRLIDPRSDTRKLINTTIHFDFPFNPQNLLKSPWSLPRGSPEYHCGLLARSFGGYYPAVGQFERAAEPYFELVTQRDATYDYHLTSEAWLAFGRRSLLSPATWKRLLPFVLRYPRQATTMLYTLLVSQTWNWQFRGDRPPMKHLWQTWRYKVSFEAG